MEDWLHIAVWSFVSSLTSRRDLALENIALRQQLMVLQRQTAAAWPRWNVNISVLFLGKGISQQ